MPEKELEHFWFEQNPDGTYTVEPGKLIFSIILDELCIAECLHTCDEDYPDRVPRDVLIERWKAKIANLRQLKKTTVVRATYYQFYVSKDSTRADFPQRWKAAWEHANYLFNVDLDEAWLHLTDPEAYSKKIREESRKLFGRDLHA